MVASCYTFMTDADLEVVSELPTSLLDEVYEQSAPPLSQKQIQLLQLVAEPLKVTGKRAKSHLEDLAASPEPKTRRELAVGLFAMGIIALAVTQLVLKVQQIGKGPGTGKKVKDRFRMKIKHR